MPTGPSAAHGQENYWNVENNSTHQDPHTTAAYWSYMQQFSAPQQNQPQQFVESPWNQVGYSWGNLPSQTQQHGQYQQQQQVQQQQQNYENYHQWNAYQNEMQHQQQMAYNNYPIQQQSFASNIQQQSTANNNYEAPQYQNMEYVDNTQQYQATRAQTANAAVSQPVQYYNQIEAQNVLASAFTPVYPKSTYVDNSQPLAATDAHVRTSKEQWSESNRSLSTQQQNSTSTAQKEPSPPTEQPGNASSADNNQWGGWGDEGDLDFEDNTVSAFYGRDDDVDYSHLNTQQQARNESNPVPPRNHGVSAPDLVATSQSAPDNQATAENEFRDLDKQQRKPPDLFSGHELNPHRNGPDVVSSYDAAQADVLEDVCLDAPVVQDLEHNHNYKGASLAQVVTKWGQKLVNNLASEADKDTCDSLSSQNLNSQAATLSLAGIAYQQPAAQPRSRSSSTVSATSPKLGFSELLTYSYYEAEVKRPTVEEGEVSELNKPADNVTAPEVSVSAEDQLPEADLAQWDQKWNHSAETLNQPQTDLTEDDSTSSPVTVLDITAVKTDLIEENPPTEADSKISAKNSFSLPKTYPEAAAAAAAAEDEENWSMVENYDDRSKADLPSASITYNNSLSSWNQWEDDEEGRESPEENLETRGGVTNNQAMSDWRPESERDEPETSTVQQNVHDECVDVEEWLHCQREAEGSDVVVELSHSKEFEITVNEPVNVAPIALVENRNLQPVAADVQPVVAHIHPIIAHTQPVPAHVQPLTVPKFDLDNDIAPDDRRENASMWSAISNVDDKSVREMPVDDTESTENRTFPAESCGSSSQPSPNRESHHTESVVDPLLIDRFLQDTNQMVNSNVRKQPPLRRDDSSVWSTMANPETDSIHVPVVKKVSPVKDQHLPASRKKVESISSQGSSAISLSRKLTQNFAAANKDPDTLQADSLANKRRESLHKRYKEATKKSKEIFARLNVSLLSTTLETSTLGRQTPLIIVPSISEASSNVPTPEPSPATLFSKSIKAKSTPVQSEMPPKGDNEQRRENDHDHRRENERERRRDHVDDRHLDEPPPHDLEPDRIHPERRRNSDLENRRDSHSGRNFDYDRRRNGRRPNSRASEQADWRHHSFNDEGDDENDGSWRNRRRPYSRASERDDWSRYQKAEDFRHRPHSTQGFDSEEDSGEYEDDEVKDYYRKWRQYQNDSYSRHRAQQYSWGMNQSRSFYGQQQPSMDPGWQKYLTDFYKLNGYYPTYEQLHRMWAEQHATAAKIQQQKPLKVRVPKLGAIEKIIEPTAVALKRTEEYVADQRQQLFSDEKESEPSISRPENNQLTADSDRSYDVPSSVSAIETYQVQVPFKHSVAHAVCRFGVGGHLTIVSGGNRASGQRQTVVEIRHIRNVIKNDAEIDENLDKMDSFPGPLLPSSSDKSALIQFCQRKAEKYRHDLTVMDRDSAVLIWNLLICLIRQNGAVVGADLARLLMDGREICDSTNVVEVEKHTPPRRHSHDDDYEEINAYERSLVTSATQTTDRVEQHFRELLLGGTKKEALEWAIKYKLWGHALFLAMKIDQRTHTNVMIRFANSLALNDPLQTLYQMMSGVMPYASTQLPDDKWGDWRPHLAIILSNLSLLNGVAVDGQAFEREMMSVLTLGNTLMDDGRTFAAQFCYLCCHLLSGWDVFSVQQRRQYVSLIGAHCDLKQDEIFTLDRIQMTEIYEYAVGLMYAQAKQTFCLPTIQNYKLRYVLHLAELGFAEDAYKYCVVLSSAIQQMPNLYNYSMVSLVVDFGTKLQRFDSSNEHMNFGYQQSQTSPQWVIDLNMIAQGLKDGTIGPIQPVGQQQQQQQQLVISNQNTVDHHYSSQQQPPTVPIADDHQKHFYVGQPEDQPMNVVASLIMSEESTTKVDSRRSSTQQSNATGREMSFGRDSVEPEHGRKMSAVSSPRHSVGRDRLDSIEDHVDSIATSNTYFAVDNRERDRKTYAEVASPPMVTVDEHQPMMNSNYGQPMNQNDTDFYDRMSNQITPAFGNTPTNKSYQARAFYSTSSEGGVGGGSDSVFTPSPRQNELSGKSSSEISAQQRLKPEQKVEPKRNTSWIGRKLGGVVTKLLPSPNQMILPDDKQKAIVWDEKAGRWINMNGEDVDETPPPPPPSLASSASNMMSGSGQFQAVAQQEFVGAVNAALPDQQPPVVKPVNRFASQGKRYATINSFGAPSSSSNTTAATAPGGMPPLPLPTVGTGPAQQKHYFVPQATSSNEEYVDPFSTVENNPSGTVGKQ